MYLNKVAQDYYRNDLLFNGNGALKNVMNEDVLSELQNVTD